MSTDRSPIAPDRTPVIHGIRAQINPETFRRKWPERYVPWSEPDHPKPEVSKTILRYALSRNRKGVVNGVEIINNEHGVVLPPGARRMIMTLAPLPGWELIISYARGWRVNAKGETMMKIIWGKTATDDGKEARVKTGEEMPPAQESVFVRAYAQNGDGLVLLAGQWINGSWDQGHAVVMPNIRLTKVGWQPSKTKERAQGQRHALDVPTLSEWLNLAPELPVKPEPPAWPPGRHLFQ